MRNSEIITILKEQLASVDKTCADCLRGEFMSVHADVFMEDLKQMHAYKLAAKLMVNGFSDVLGGFVATERFRAEHAKFPLLHAAFNERHPNHAAARAELKEAA